MNIMGMDIIDNSWWKPNIMDRILKYYVVLLFAILCSC